MSITIRTDPFYSVKIVKMNEPFVEIRKPVCQQTFTKRNKEQEKGLKR
jgi:hypothetical protein